MDEHKTQVGGKRKANKGRGRRGKKEERRVERNE